MALFGSSVHGTSLQITLKHYTVVNHSDVILECTSDIVTTRLNRPQANSVKIIIRNIRLEHEHDHGHTIPIPLNSSDRYMKFIYFWGTAMFFLFTIFLSESIPGPDQLLQTD